MRHIFTNLLLCGLLSGCAAGNQITERPQEFGDEDEVQGSEFAAGLRLFVVTERGERAVAEGETLHSGDRIFLNVTANQQAYVYAVLFAPDSSTSVLFPQDGRQLASARCPLRIPQTGTLYLQDPPGLENLRVAVSLRPLPQSDRRLCEMMRLPCTQLASQAPEQPPACEQASKPIERTRGMLSSIKIGKDAGNGVVALKLPFNHAR